jgi:hypothetical protein
MVRYRQELFFGCYADPDMLPEVHELPALLEGELEALGAAAAGRRTAAPAPAPAQRPVSGSGARRTRTAPAGNGRPPLVPAG